MTKIVVTALLALLIPVSAGASGLEGKAIICLDAYDPPIGKTYNGFKFIEDRKVSETLLYMNESGVVEIVDLGGLSDPLHETPDAIEWWGVWSLNRKTLELTADGFDIGYPCEAFNNFAEYEEALENYRREMVEATGYMEGNKI